MSKILEVKELTKKYKDTMVVDHIDFCVEKGEVFGLLGPNGAGKSTTVMMLTTYLESTDGYFSLEGVSSNDKGGLGKVRKRIGYVPQEIALYDDMNPWENLLFFGKMYNLPTKVLKERVNQVLEDVGLLDRKKQLVKEFSGGMKRRLNIAAALLHNPDFVIMDEPTVGIDPQSRNRIFDVIHSLKEKGISVLYITHYMEEAELLCDHVAIIDKGHIIANDTIPKLIETLGNEFTVEVETEYNENAVEELQTKYGKDRVYYGEGKIILKENNTEDNVPDFINAVYKSGCTIKKVEIKEPSLQQVFLKLTGKELRD